MTENTDNTDESLEQHRKIKVTERSNAGKVMRRLAKQLKSHGFSRRSTFFSRERGHVIQFLHIHKFSFGPCFRMHVGFRVLNESSPDVALNGIHQSSFEFLESDESLSLCAQEMLRYVIEVAEPWLGTQTYSVLLSSSSPLYPNQKEALAAALRGEIDEYNVSLSRSLF